MLAIDQFAWSNRWHRHHPGERLLLAGGLLGLCLILPPLTAGPLILTVAAIAAVAGAGIPVSAFCRAMAVPAGFLVTGTPMLALDVDFSEGVRIGVTEDGLLMAAEVACRSLGAVACLCLLILTTPVVDVLMLARRVGVPPVIEDLALLIYHMLFALMERAVTGHRAQTARQGYAGFGQGVRSLGLLAATLFQRAMDRGRRLEIGLAARGYDGVLAILSPERSLSPGRLMIILGVLGAVTAVALALASILSFWGGSPWGR